MPIVEQPRADAPLSQGDILTNLRFFSTASCWSDKGGEAVKAPFTVCMVLSRPCVAAHKDTFLVAAVDQLKEGFPKSVDGFDKLLSFMTGIRDGRTAPDTFYLGQLPGRTGRHAARLDSVHTIATPSNDDMSAFLKKCRIGCVNIDFARDLHVRIFNAFASLGFDDHQWFSTEDLTALVDQGVADLRQLESEAARKAAAQSYAAAEGKTISDRDVEAARGKFEGFRDKLAPFQRELERRTKNS